MAFLALTSANDRQYTNNKHKGEILQKENIKRKRA